MYAKQKIFLLHLFSKQKCNIQSPAQTFRNNVPHLQSKGGEETLIILVLKELEEVFSILVDMVITICNPRNKFLMGMKDIQAVV